MQFELVAFTYDRVERALMARSEKFTPPTFIHHQPQGGRRIIDCECLALIRQASLAVSSSAMPSG